MEPHDHSDINDDALVIRRICPENHVVYDENRSTNRISSKAFKPSSGAKDGMSIDIKFLIEQANKSPSEFVTTPVFTGSVEFATGVAREAELLVGYDPLDENPYHGEIWGAKNYNRFTGAQVKKIQSKASWLVALEGVEII